MVVVVERRNAKRGNTKTLHSFRPRFAPSLSVRLSLASAAFSVSQTQTKAIINTDFN